MKSTAVFESVFRMALKEVVAQLVGNGKASESVAWKTCAVHDAEVIPYSHETSRDPGVQGRVFLKNDVFGFRDPERVDRQLSYVLLLENTKARKTVRTGRWQDDAKKHPTKRRRSHSFFSSIE
jgi:hypothetical protein